MRFLLLLMLACGCPAAHSDYPDKSCKANNDCFQGEMCVLNGESGTCQSGSSGDGGNP